MHCFNKKMYSQLNVWWVYLKSTKIDVLKIPEMKKCGLCEYSNFNDLKPTCFQDSSDLSRRFLSKKRCRLIKKAFIRFQSFQFLKC